MQLQQILPSEFRAIDNMLSKKMITQHEEYPYRKPVKEYKIESLQPANVQTTELCYNHN